MRIAQDGLWYYMNSPIGRKPLMKLFASVLRHDDDGKYYLVTPAEKCGIRVDDAPFVAIRMTAEGKGCDQIITFETNADDVVTVDDAHPLRVAPEEGTGGLKPYVLVRARLEALGVAGAVLRSRGARHGRGARRPAMVWRVVVGPVLADAARVRNWRRGRMSDFRFDASEFRERARERLL